MLISTHKAIDLILQDLSLHPSTRVQEILARFEARGIRMTRQAVHRNLSQLKELDVIVSESGRYSLKLSWIIGARKFINDVSLRYFGPEIISQIQPDVGETKEWRFPNMIEMDSFGCHVDLALIRTVSDPDYFAWEPYPWYVPFAPEQEANFANAIRLLGKRRSIIVGGMTFLHKIRSTLGNDDVFRIIFDSSFSKEFNLFEYLYGTFILEVRIPEETTLALDRLHKSVNSETDFDLGELRRIVSHKAGDVVIRLWNNPEEAEERRKAYREIFTVSTK